MKVKTKFICSKIKRSGVCSGEVIFSAVTGTSEENEQFWKATPSGNLHMHIDNKLAFASFNEGDEYFLEISPCVNRYQNRQEPPCEP